MQKRLPSNQPHPQRQHRQLLVVLALLALLLAACGRAPGRGTPTPLPPGPRQEQPTPEFQGGNAPESGLERPADADNTNGSTNGSDADRAAALKAQLATQIAQTRAQQNSDPAQPGLRAALGIVSQSGTGLWNEPGGNRLRELLLGESLTVTGRSADGRWLAGYTDRNEAGWVAVTDVRIFGGSLQELAVVSQSALPEGGESPGTGGPTGPDVATAPPPAESPAQPNAPIAPAPPGNAGTVAVPGINIRAGPDISYPIVATAESGESFPILARNEVGDWLQLDVPAAPQGFGWAFAPLLQTSVDIAGLGVSTETSADPLPEPDAAAPAAPAPPADASSAPVAGLAGTLVFQDSRGGTIYRYRFQTGELAALTAGSDPAISPDGRTVAFVRGGAANGVYLIDIDGSNERRIFSGSAPGSPKWSPDGSALVFSHQTGKAEPCRMTALFGCVPQAQIDQLIDEFFGGELPPDIDLNQWPLVERATENLSRIDPNGGNYRDLPSLTTVAGPDWGTWGIVYHAGTGLQISEDRPGAESKILIDGFNRQDPDWKPNGERILFQSQEGDRWEIFKVNSDGADARPLTRPPLFSEVQPHNVAPAWSPDGNWIVFLSNRSGAWKLWVMDAEGGQLQQLPIDVPLDYRFQGEQAVDWGP